MKQILFLFVVIPMLCFGQNDEAHVDKLTEEFTTKLGQNGTTDYIVTKHYCSGSMEIFRMANGRSCITKESYFEVYVIWVEESTTYLKKIDNCGLYHTLLLEDVNINSYFSENLEALESKSVKNYVSETYTGTPELRKPVQPCFRQFRFAKNGNSFTKMYNLYDVSNDSDGKNKNYNYNQSLPLIKLNGMIETLIEQQKNKFRRLE